MYSDRMMRNMLQNMGMGGMMPGGLFGGFPAPQGSQMGQDPFSAMMPQGFMNPMSMMMMDPFQSMQQAMSAVGNGSNGQFSYCSSSVTSYTTDEHGRPQVYQQSNEVKQGPDGIRETKSAVHDSKTGHRELAIGHHLHDKAHIKKKTKNVYTGEEEQAEDFINIEEQEAEAFEDNWRSKAKNITLAPGSSYNQIQYHQQPGRSSRNNRLALASSAREDLLHSPTHRQSPNLASSSSSTQQHNNHNQHHHSHPLNTVKSAIKAIKKKKKSKEAKV